MIHAFTIVRRADVSRSNIVANYLDLEHIPVHAGLRAARVLSETDRSVCFRLDSKVFGFYFTNIHYFEFRPPDRILQAVNTLLGPMRVLATVRELGPDATETTVEVELDLPAWAYPFRRPLEALLRRLNRRIFEEDMTIMARRQRLFADHIEDYLREGQYLMCKEEFRRCYSKRSAARA